MCGRFLIEGNDEFAEILSFAGEIPAAFKLGEIFPSAVVPVLTAPKTRAFMSWGYPDYTGKRPLINARSETAATARTFRESMAARRCIIPATSYFEWKPLDTRKKEKYEFRSPDNSLLYMAGIFSSDGRFAVLTREAAPDIAEIHDRMPVILPHTLTDEWLNKTPDVLCDAITALRFEPVSPPTEAQLNLFGN